MQRAAERNTAGGLPDSDNSLARHGLLSAIQTPDHRIEDVTLERLSREQNLDRRTIRKRIKQAIDRPREAEKDLP